MHFVRSPKDAIREAPQSPSPNPAMASSNPRVEFYDKYRRETDEHDRDFTKKYDDDLSNTLIFVSVFSPSTSIVKLIRFSGGTGRSVLCRRNRFRC